MMPLALRQAAQQDIENGFTYYLQEASATIATSFITALDDALHHIQLHSGTGSSRYEETLDIPGLRFWLVSRFPYAAFYIERADQIDVLRVLHQHSDIPAHLRDELS